MINIFILGFDKTYTSSLVTFMDIFQMAQQLLQDEQHNSKTRELKIKLVSTDGKPILCQNNILLNVHCGLEDVHNTDSADIIIITSIHDVDTTLREQSFMVDWLKEQHKKGTTLVTICTGSFLLAETGLLDGKETTTHWSMKDEFKKRYPAVKMNSEKMVINHGNIYCSAGAGSSTDLAYCLLEKYYGHSLAARTAKFFVHDFRRCSQSVYTIYDTKTDHTDKEILKTQYWIQENLSEPLKINELSDMSCMSQRTFERRFKKASGDTPIVYIQKMKVEKAKEKLETTNLSFDEISYNLGYRNSSSFRKIFVKWVNLLPSEYRERFQSYYSGPRKLDNMLR